MKILNLDSRRARLCQNQKTTLAWQKPVRISGSFDTAFRRRASVSFLPDACEPPTCPAGALAKEDVSRRSFSEGAKVPDLRSGLARASFEVMSAFLAQLQLGFNLFPGDSRLARVTLHASRNS